MRDQNAKRAWLIQWIVKELLHLSKSVIVLSTQNSTLHLSYHHCLTFIFHLVSVLCDSLCRWQNQCVEYVRLLCHAGEFNDLDYKTLIYIYLPSVELSEKSNKYFHFENVALSLFVVFWSVCLGWGGGGGVVVCFCFFEGGGGGTWFAFVLFF